MSYLILAGAMALLIYCGDLLVSGSVALAKRVNISPLIIGLTIVGFGTSAPELLVSINAALEGLPGLALGNVVGSNIANILVVLGIPALYSAIETTAPYVIRNTFYMLGAAVIFIALCAFGPLIWWHGIILLALCGGFLWSSAQCIRRDNHDEKADFVTELDEFAPDDMPRWKMILYIFSGLIGLPLAAHWTVEAAEHIALAWGVSEATIGLTLVAFGTSLPELVAGIMSVSRGQSSLALGNVVGSNIFNITSVIGITALVAPVAVPATFLYMDLWVMLAASLALVPFTLAGWKLGRAPAVAFLVAYIVYVIVILAPKTQTMMAAI